MRKRNSKKKEEDNKKKREKKGRRNKRKKKTGLRKPNSESLAFPLVPVRCSKLWFLSKVKIGCRVGRMWDVQQ